MLETFAARAKRVPLYLRLPLILGPIALSSYWFATESGLFWFFATLEADLLWGGGSYHPTLAWALSLLVLLAPSLTMVSFLASFFVERSD